MFDFVTAIFLRSVLAFRCDYENLVALGFAVFEETKN
jgi:hypothetical protein